MTRTATNREASTLIGVAYPKLDFYLRQSHAERDMEFWLLSFVAQARRDRNEHPAIAPPGEIASEMA